MVKHYKNNHNNYEVLYFYRKPNIPQIGNTRHNNTNKTSTNTV